MTAHVAGIWTWDLALAAVLLALCVLGLVAVIVYWVREIWRQRQGRR